MEKSGIARRGSYAFSDQQSFKDSKVPSILARNPNLRGIGDSHYSKQEQVIPKLTNPKKRIDKKRNKQLKVFPVSRLKDRKSLNHSIEEIERI